MKSWFGLALLSLIIVKTTQVQGQTMFQKTYGNMDYINSVQQTTDGGYIFVGDDHAYYGISIIKTDFAGSILWSKTYKESTTGQGKSIIRTNDNGYFIAGKSCSSIPTNKCDIYLIKINSVGDTSWTKKIGGSGSFFYINSICQISDGGYVITGFYSISSHGNYRYILKIDSYGNMLWLKDYGPGECNNIKQSSDGGFITVGNILNYSTGGLDVLLIKTDINGIVQWSKTYGGLDNDDGTSVQQTLDGGYIITGICGTNNNVYLIKTDNSGNVSWSKTYGGSSFDWGLCVKQTNDEGYIITGMTTSFAISYSDTSNIYLIKTNSTGDTLWTKSIGEDGRDGAHNVIQTSDGGYIIAGGTTSFSGGYMAYLIKTDIAGNSNCHQYNTKTTITNPSIITGNAVIQDSSFGVAHNTSTTLVSCGFTSNIICSNAGIEEINAKSIYSIFPNPATSTLSITTPPKSTIQIHTLQGQTIKTITAAEGRTNIDISALARGMYFVKVRTEKDVAVRKFVKE